MRARGWGTPQQRWMLIAAAALTVVWLAFPASVPIYDGVGTDQPYRYVTPPPGAPHTSAPTAARRVLTVAAGRNTAGYANSGEFGPQVSWYVPAGAFRVPAGARRVTVVATPTAPPPPLPRDGRIVTNVYRLTATADNSIGGLTAIGTGDKAPTLQMRAPSSRQPGPVFEHLDAGQWRRTSTLRVGQDVYQTSAPALGDWALVQLDHPTGGDTGNGINVGLLAAGIAILVFVALLLGVRRWRTR